MRLSRLAVAGIALFIGVAVGASSGVFVDQSYPEYVPPLTLWGQGRSQQSQIDQGFRIIEAHYYNHDLDYSKLKNSALSGLVSGLGDPFSQYFSPPQYRNEQQEFSGSYTGVGIYLDFSGQQPRITGVVSDSPAEHAGIQAGDVIQAVDGKSTSGASADAVSSWIQGQSGTSVSMAVARGSQTLELSMVRAHLTTPMVASRSLPNGVLYIRIYRFGDNTTSEFDRQLKTGLVSSSAVVLDLREDPGGYIDSAQDVISRFVRQGEVFELHERDGSIERRNSRGAHPAAGVPVVVLVDANTASAAEMVAGSLQVNRRAQLVGTRTFGKGSVQQDFELSGGADLHLTVARWYLPGGTTVDRRGLTPDVSVQMSPGQQIFDVRNSGSEYQADPQLVRALQVVSPAFGTGVLG